MRFRDYLTEMAVEATKRQGIVHFEKMKPYEFLELAREIVAKDKKLEDVKVSLKVDGASARFGRDDDGKFFFETGKSGLIKTPKAFSEYTLSRGGNPEMITRAIHYDNMFDALERSDLWQDFPPGTKAIIEICYNPMAEVIEDKLKFVSIHYDKDKLGTLMTIVPIEIIGDYDIKHLLKKSTKKIKIISPHLGRINIDLDIDLDIVNEIDERVLKSLKHADREQKAEYVDILQGLKDEIAKIILNYPMEGKNKLGEEIEGLVVELNGKLYKVTTPSFKEEKRQDKLNRKVSEDLSPPLPKFEKENIPPFESTSGDFIGTFNQTKIYLSDYFSDYQTFVIFDDNNEAISFVVLETTPDRTIKGQDRIKIVRTWTKPEMRRKGYLTIIFRFLIDKLSLKLVSDTHLTQDSIDMYQNFIEKRKFLNTFFYNRHNGKSQHEVPSDLWTMPNNWRICLEDHDEDSEKNIKFDGMPGYRKLEELCIYLTDCM